MTMLTRLARRTPAGLRRLLPALPVLLAAGIAVWAGPAAAQSLSIDLGDQTGSTTGRIIQFVALLTVLSLAPSILVMMTCFVRITIVLSFLRSAMGTMQVPPNQVLVSLALFLTFFIMAPVLQQSWQNGIQPLINEDIDEMTAFSRAVEPFHGFMMTHVRERDLELFMDISKTPPVADPKDVPLQVVIPAFMLSELKRSFEIGFLIFVPFLVIDMVISSVLMAMGMMMLPPTMVALPFKLIFFVLVDGWYLVVGSLVQSFGT